MSCALQACPTGLLDLTREACLLAGWGPGRRVLDIGCGNGSSVDCMRREFGLSAFGVDLLPPRGDVVFQGRAEMLPLAAGSVDGILAECSLSAMADLERVIAECARVLAPGGSLVMADLYSRGTEVADGVFDRDELMARLRRHGFAIRSWKDRSDVLKQLVFRLIMERDCGERSLHQLCEWKKTRPGYFLLIAERREKESIWATNRCE
jgi:arsenite methyltransferase